MGTAARGLLDGCVQFHHLRLYLGRYLLHRALSDSCSRPVGNAFRGRQLQVALTHHRPTCIRLGNGVVRTLPAVVDRSIFELV